VGREDLAQDTLVRVFSLLGKTDGKLENPKAYLIRTAANLWIDWVWRSAREQAAMVLESLPVSVTDLSFLGRAMGVQLDGVMGRSFLRHLAMTLDYATNALTLRRPMGGTERALGEREVAFRWANAEDLLVVVPVFVNEKGPYDFALDTGASSMVISLELAIEFGLVTEKISQLTAGGGNGTVSRVRLRSLSVGAARQENLAAAASDFLTQLNAELGSKLQGIVGYDFLRHYRVTLDYPRAALSLE
jgi:predicted aspartyl protease